MRWFASLPIVLLLAMASQGEDDVIFTEEATRRAIFCSEVQNSFEQPVESAEILTGFDFPMSKELGLGYRNLPGERRTGEPQTGERQTGGFHGMFLAAPVR